MNSDISIPKPHWRASSLLASIGMLFSSVAPYAQSQIPQWWQERSVIDAGSTENNKAVANLGQAKWMATQALAELKEIAPALAANINLTQVFPAPPETPDVGWFEAQKAPLNLGQLKAISHQFYDALPPAWLADQALQNGIIPWVAPYPWDINTPVEENLKLANIGQLKAVFSLRFQQDKDNAGTGDTLPDVWEQQIIDADPSDTIHSFDDIEPSGHSPAADLDQDGFNNLAEHQLGFDPLVANTSEEGAVAHWTFDVDGGNITVDQSGNGFDAELIAGPSVAPRFVADSGFIGGGMEFGLQSGSEASYMKLSNGIVQSAESLTYSFWYKTDDPSGIHLFLSAAIPTNTNELLFGAFSYQYEYWDGGDIVIKQNPPNWYDGRWHHHAFVRDAENGEVRIYIDGELFHSGAITAHLLNIHEDGLMIGQDQDSVGGGFDVNQRLRGVLDEVRLYRRALSDEQVIALTQVDGDDDGIADVWEYAIIDFDLSDSIRRPEHVLPDGDFDGDLLTNLEEYLAGTNPLDEQVSPDSDNDGLPDAWEQQIIDADPNDTIIAIEDVLGAGDFDEDSISNYAEYAHGTDPVGTVSIPELSWLPLDPDTLNGIEVSHPLSNIGSTLTKISGTDAHDASASLSSILTGDGGVTCRADLSNPNAYYGLTTAAPNSRNDGADITYAIYFTEEDAISIYENGTEILAQAATVGTYGSFSIERYGENIQYLHNGQIIYTSEQKSTDPLFFDSSFYFTACTLTHCLKRGFVEVSPTLNSDEDGLPDLWEIVNGYDPLKEDTDGNGTNDGDEDPDGDGLTNAQEAAVDTNPKSSDSDGDGYNDLEELYALNTDPIVPTAAYTYVDESLDSDGDGLANYLERMIGTNSLTPGDVWEEPEPQDIDSDGDGLKDSEETTTDPGLFDTDGDGYGDGWELSYNMDPLDPMDVYDAIDFWTLPEAYRLATGLDDWEDEDGDGLSNADEFWDGTDPLLWDTDGDGVSDGDEVYLFGTDPMDGLPYYRDQDGDDLTAWEEGLLGTSDTNVDSDEDGISDYEEVKVQNVYLAQFGLPGFDPTDPLDGQADWDLDGVTNADEIAAGTDYLNIDDDGDGIANFAELKLGTDPLAANDFGNSDQDGDGLSTLAERDLGTDDLSADTDGDGLSDYLEGSSESPFASYMNPLDGSDASADMDGDGLSTIYEISIMLNSGGAGSSGEANQFDPLDYHPDNLVQYNYDPSTAQTSSFNPFNQDSDGNGLLDGDEDLDGDGLTNIQENLYRSDPLKKDTDNDSILDKEDGWPWCEDLAPERIVRHQYAIIKVKEFPASTTSVYGEINNNGHWLINSFDETTDASGNTIYETLHFYYNGESTSSLPTEDSTGMNFNYSALNEENYFLRGGTSIGQYVPDEENRYTTPGVLYQGGSTKEVMPYDTPFSAGFGYAVIRGAEHFTSVENTGTVHSHSYRETSPEPARLPAPGAEYASLIRNSSSLGNPIASEQIAGVSARADGGDGVKGFTYTTSSPLDTVKKESSNYPHISTPSWVTGGYISHVYKTNSQDLSLASRTKLQDFWVSDNIQYGTVSHELWLWNGMDYVSFDDAPQVDDPSWRQYSPYYANRLRVESEISASLNNKNTIMLDADIWLDEKSGLRNDQPVDKNPSYKKITWDSTWGSAPPTNLNTRMQGYESGSSRIWQNGYWLDLINDELLTNSDYSEIKTRDINDHGVLAAEATNAAGNKCAVLLLPVEVGVDANRDGEIKFDGSDVTSADKPYQFWVNDDTDIEHTVDKTDSEEDDLETGFFDNISDSDVKGIKSKRDLEDFTRLWVDLSSIQQIFGENLDGVTVSIQLKKSEGSPLINLFGAVENEGGREYLKDADIGQTQTFSSEIFTWVGNLERDFNYIVLANNLRPDGKLMFLFEGANKGKGEIIFKVKKGDTEIILPSVHIELKDVTDMYETWSVGDVTYGGVHWQNSWPSSNASQTTGVSFPSPETDEEKDYILFIHGWNMPSWEKETFASTMFKRMWHQGYKGRFGAFRWPTFHGFELGDSGDLAHYDGSEQRAWASASPLAKLVKNLAQTYKNSDGSLVRCYAHSMGNVVTSEALRLMRTESAVHTYISAQAAIPASMWDETVRPLEILGAPNTPNIYGYYWQTGVTSDPDKWQNENRPSYMAAQYMPADSFYINHHNIDDWALKNWTYGQVLKPDVDYQWERIGWTSQHAFTHNTGTFTEEILEFPDDRHEIFSFASQSWSYATGAEGATGGMFDVGESVNLKTQFSFEKEHKGHSAQFRSTIQKRWTYWERAIQDMKVVIP